MKVFISSDNKTMEGFTNVNMHNITEELKQIPNNSCTMIIAPDVIDCHEYNAIKNIIALLYSKIRLTGRLYLSGIDAGILSRLIIANSVELSEVSKAIENIKSVHSLDEINTILSQYKDLEINTQIKGIKYECAATRI